VSLPDRHPFQRAIALELDGKGRLGILAFDAAISFFQQRSTCAWNIAPGRELSAACLARPSARWNSVFRRSPPAGLDRAVEQFGDLGVVEGPFLRFVAAAGRRRLGFASRRLLLFLFKASRSDRPWRSGFSRSLRLSLGLLSATGLADRAFSRPAFPPVWARRRGRIGHTGAFSVILRRVITGLASRPFPPAASDFLLAGFHAGHDMASDRGNDVDRQGSSGIDSKALDENDTSPHPITRSAGPQTHQCLVDLHALVPCSLRDDASRLNPAPTIVPSPCHGSIVRLLSADEYTLSKPRGRRNRL